MSSISALTSYPPYVSSAQQALPTSQTDADATSTDTTQHVHRRGGHHHGGGGQVQQALEQALQNLGLAPSPTSSPGNTDGSANSPDTDDGSASTAQNIRKDMHQFMHSLYEAVKSEGSTTAANGTADAGNAKANFSTGLSALISQASSGNAPAGLQEAFDKLSSDLQSQGSGSGSTNAVQPATLQDLLSQMQQSLGYSNAGGGTTDNILNTKA